LSSSFVKIWPHRHLTFNFMIRCKFMCSDKFAIFALRQMGQTSLTVFLLVRKILSTGIFFLFWCKLVILFLPKWLIFFYLYTCRKLLDK
jgi:hypothetical protein